MIATTRSPATRRRGEDLNALFANPEVDVVQALHGGFGSAQTIPYLDFDLIAANPKPLVGYSDLTALHVAIRQRAGVATIYGLAGGRCDREHRIRRTASSTSSGQVEQARFRGIRTIRGSARSTAAVRPRSSSAAACGCSCRRWERPRRSSSTGRASSSRLPVLFFEDTHTPPCYLDGHRRRRGAVGEVGLRRLRPVSDWARSRTIEDVLEEQLEPLGIPVLYGFPLGNTKHVAALPLGLTCTLDADGKTLTVDEQALR